MGQRLGGTYCLHLQGTGEESWRSSWFYRKEKGRVTEDSSGQFESGMVEDETGFARDNGDRRP
jgi:hypothetical protein